MYDRVTMMLFIPRQRTKNQPLHYNIIYFEKPILSYNFFQIYIQEERKTAPHFQRLVIAVLVPVNKNKFQNTVKSNFIVIQSNNLFLAQAQWLKI